LIKHAIPITAHFDWALAVTFAAPEDALKSLLAPGLVLDTLRGHGFLAVACVQTSRLRPVKWPRALGLNFFLAGYRLFTRFASPAGPEYRGLQILGSETDRWVMVAGGNLFTHYGYEKVSVRASPEGSCLSVSTSTGLDLEVEEKGAALPEGSVFRDWAEARRFAGPMPYTFASERAGRGILRVRGVRTHWEPRPVTILCARAPFLERLVSGELSPAVAFLVENVEYRWEKGIREGIRNR